MIVRHRPPQIYPKTPKYRLLGIHKRGFVVRITTTPLTPLPLDAHPQGFLILKVLHMALGGKQVNSPVGNKGYTGNKNGRPSDKLRNLTPSELRSALLKLKRVTPRAIDILVNLMEKEGGVSQGKIAKELITLYVSLDKHAVARATEMQKLLKDIEKPDSPDTKDASSAFDDDSETTTPVFTLHYTNKKESSLVSAGVT